MHFKGRPEVTPFFFYAKDGGIVQTPDLKSRLHSTQPVIMGILNLTPDSFSDGLPKASVEDFLFKADELISQGADVLDVGGESTRPGAHLVSLPEEKERVLPFLSALRKKHPDVIVSLDTRKPELLLEALEYGVDIVNDTSFLTDLRLAEIAKNENLHYVLMHARGTPENMNALTDYPQGLFETIFQECSQKILQLRRMGFDLKNLILDPGFGFAKTPEQSKTLMENLSFWTETWRKLDLPEPSQLLLGISRKRFLQLYSGENQPQERDELSADLSKQAVQCGFRWIRTHNVSLTRKRLCL